MNRQQALFWLAALILLTPLCGYFFSCGCDWPWNGLFMGCNAILENALPPHCPWCVHLVASMAGIGLSLAGGSWTIAYGGNFRVLGSAGFSGAALGLLVFLLLLFLAGWITALAVGHSSFLGMDF